MPPNTSSALSSRKPKPYFRGTQARLTSRCLPAFANSGTVLKRGAKLSTVWCPTQYSTDDVVSRGGQRVRAEERERGKKKGCAKYPKNFRHTAIFRKKVSSKKSDQELAVRGDQPTKEFSSCCSRGDCISFAGQTIQRGRYRPRSGTMLLVQAQQQIVLMLIRAVQHHEKGHGCCGGRCQQWLLDPHLLLLYTPAVRAQVDSRTRVLV